MRQTGQIYNEDALAFLRSLPDGFVQCCVTSPPYWGLRDYGVAGQLGLEKTPEEYVTKLVEIFREVRRVLREDGTLWLNLGDSYATGAGKVGDCPGGGVQGDNWNGHRGSRGGSKKQPHTGAAIGPAIQPNRMPLPGLKPKDLVGIPWLVAFALRADGWWLRQDIIWSKPNPMPESVTDRCTKSHEYIFLLTKSERYYYDAESILEPASMATILDGRFERDGPQETLYGESVPKARGLGRGPRIRKSDKQRGHSRRHAGFNDRWDAMTKEEQCSVMRNKRGVWTVATKPLKEAHFATFPPEIPQTCILAGTKKGDVVLDPFMGAGTTAVVAERLDRQWIGSELNADYIAIAQKRIDTERAQMKLAL